MSSTERNLPIGATFLVIVLLGATVPSRAVPQNGCSTERISADASGVQGNSESSCSRRNYFSADARVIAFTSLASNLVPGDSNLRRDVFVHDRWSGSKERVSVDSNGTQGNGDSAGGSLSADGRFVNFDSAADNLVPADTNGEFDVFVHDRVTKETTRVSVSSSGQEGNLSSLLGMISGDGRFVVFYSDASNLVPGDTNAVADIFVHDRVSGETTRVSVSSQGVQADSHCVDPVISYDGRFVAFSCWTSMLAPGANSFGGVFLRDRASGTTELVSVTHLGGAPDGLSGAAGISADGRFVAFSSSASNLVPGDTNSLPDIFVRDRALGTTKRVSVSSAGVQTNSDSQSPTISPDGRFIAFESAASNLVVPDTNGTWDVFLHDRVTGVTFRASMSSTGVGGNWESHRASVSSDGRHVVFDSLSTNLVPGDTNGSRDVFVRSCTPIAPRSYCLAKVNSLGCTSVLTSSGTPSASVGSGFLIRATNVRNKKAGVLLYSTSSASMLPFQGGYLCLLPPVRRSLGVSSGGSPSGHDCTGTFSADFNAWVASGKDPALIQGQDVWTQFWSRDPGFPPPDNTGLTQGMTFVLGP